MASWRHTTSQVAVRSAPPVVQWLAGTTRTLLKRVSLLEELVTLQSQVIQNVASTTASATTPDLRSGATASEAASKTLVQHKFADRPRSALDKSKIGTKRQSTRTVVLSHNGGREAPSSASSGTPALNETPVVVDLTAPACEMRVESVGGPPCRPPWHGQDTDFTAPACEKKVGSVGGPPCRPPWHDQDAELYVTPFVVDATAPAREKKVESVGGPPSRPPCHDQDADLNAEDACPHQCDGAWLRTSDGLHVCTIREGLVKWSTKYQHPEAHVGVCKQGLIELTYNGTIYSGAFEDGSNNKILWSDGDVWERTTEEPDRQSTDGVQEGAGEQIMQAAFTDYCVDSDPVDAPTACTLPPLPPLFADRPKCDEHSPCSALDFASGDRFSMDLDHSAWQDADDERYARCIVSIEKVLGEWQTHQLMLLGSKFDALDAVDYHLQRLRDIREDSCSECDFGAFKCMLQDRHGIGDQRLAAIHREYGVLRRACNMNLPASPLFEMTDVLVPVTDEGDQEHMTHKVQLTP